MESNGLTMKVKEILATIGVVVVMVGVPALMLLADNHASASPTEGAKVFTLSGVAKNGVWTLDEVQGINYWWKTFDPAIIYVNEGDDVVLRLQSTDVHHRFYAPALGIELVNVEPGHMELVEFRADTPGVYRYYCTSICGDRHFHMTGWIVVTAEGESPVGADTLAIEAYDDDLPKPSQDDMIVWGEYLYRQKGCVTCHGDAGRGDIVNFNYVKDTIPAHDTLAEKLFLDEREDADAFIELLLTGADLEEAKGETDIPQFVIVLTQYRAAKDLIINGKYCAKLDAAGFEPPLQMPSWREMLTDRDVDSIIAYLLTLYPWEEEEDWDDEDE